MEHLLDHPDHRVRAQTIAALPAFLAADDMAPQVVERALQRLGAALNAPEPDVAGNAAIAVAHLGEADDERETLAQTVRASLATPLLERARQPGDNQELVITLLDALAVVRPPGSEDVCRAAHAHGNRTVREHARACVRSLTGADPGSSSARASQPMPGPGLDIIDHAFLQRSPVLILETTRGAIRIELMPDIAPAHVAAILALVEDGFYTDLSWHRVVPDFVVQGGDPTGSGWGGPDFELPAEPWWSPFKRGAVGIADAGLDTGGSQLFIMHTRAHRLDGRYTLIGYVSAGQEIVDSLMVGDRIQSARVE